MKNYSHEEALKIILLAAKQYQSLFENKDFMIIYKEKEIIKYKLIGFSKGNFCHLTGADIKNARVKTTATEFSISKRKYEFKISCITIFIKIIL